MKSHRSTPGTPRRGNTQGRHTSALATPSEGEDQGILTGALLTSELQKRLEDLELAGSHPQNSVIAYNSAALNNPRPKDTFSSAKAILATDRRSSAIQDRERALLDIVQALSQKYEPQRVDAALLNDLIRAASTCRSELEEMAALQAIPAALAQFGEDHTDFSEAYEAVNDYLPRLYKRVRDAEGSVDAQAQAVTAYATLSYFTQHGGGGFESLQLADQMMEIAEGTTTAQARLAVAALMGAALATTLSRDADSAAIDLMPSLVPFLEMASTEIVLTAAKVVALLCEQFKGDIANSDTKLSESGPHCLDVAEVIQALEAAKAESAKRTAKRDKKERASLLRDAIATVKGSRPETVGRFTQSNQKAVSAKSWRALIVAQHLRWALGSGLHTHLANNSLVRDLISEGSDGASDIIEATIEGSDSASPEFGYNRIAKRPDIRQARLNKLESKGLLGDGQQDY